MALVFLNRYFYPDHAATAQLLSDLAFHAARAGHAVTVIASRQRLEHPRARLPPRERLHGVQVLRVWSTRFGRTVLAGRALDYLSFHVSVALALLRVLRAGDTVIAATDPPLLGVSAGWAARLRGARLVHWLHDVFPETAQALGVRVPAGAWLRCLRDASLARARATVVLGRRMHDYVAGRGVAVERLRVIHNWSDGAAIRPLAHARNPLRREWGLEGRCVLVYSGNLGRAHDLAAVPQAAARLADLDDLVWLFVGGGAGTRALREQLVGLGVTNARFLAYQPRSRLALSLAVADVHLTALRPELEGFVVPSKVYGALAAGRPCVHLGAPGGEVGEILSTHRCGIAVPPDDDAALERAIRSLHADATLRRRMGERARRAFLRHFDQGHALAQWMAVLDAAARGADR